MAALLGALTVALAALTISMVGEVDQQLKLIIFLIAAAALAVSVTKPRRLIPLVTFLALFNLAVRMPRLDATASLPLLVLGASAMFLLPTIKLSVLPRWWKAGVGMMLCGMVLSATLGSPTDSEPWAFLLRILLGLVLASAIASNPDSVLGVARVIVLAGVVVFCGIIAQRAGVYVLVGAPYLPDRLDSFFGYYSATAGYMAMTLPVGWSLIIRPPVRRLDRPLGLIGCAVAILSLVLLESRGAIAAGIVGLAIAILLGGFRRRQLVLLASTLAASAVALVGMTSAEDRGFVLARLQDAGGINAGSDAVRQQLQGIGLDLALSKPLGIGFGQFPNYVGSGADLILFHSHSSFSQVSLDMGWLGAAGLATLFVMPLWIAGRARWRGSVDPLAAGCCGVLVGVLVQGVNDYQFAELSWSFALLALLGASASAASGLAGPNGPPQVSTSGPSTLEDAAPRPAQ